MSDSPTNSTLPHVEPSRNPRRSGAGRKAGSAKRKSRPYTEAELDQFADEVREACRETDESYFGVSSLFRNSHR
jgi:hypothetical protein